MSWVALFILLTGQVPDQPPSTPELPEPPGRPVEFVYRIDIEPSERVAEVQLTVKQEGPALRQLRFHVDPERHLGFEGDGELIRSETEEGEIYMAWQVPGGGGQMRWTSRLDHARDPRSYDARIATQWAIFRGSDIVPPSSSTFGSGSTSSGRFTIHVPKSWKVVTHHAPIEGRNRSFRLEDADRFFKRPSGWLMLGRLKILQFEVGEVDFLLASTRRIGPHLTDIRTFLRLTLPALLKHLDSGPRRITIVIAGDPMWRGGLSGPGSLYLHADRPLVASDGTSPLLHELVHVLMEARSGEDGDWIVEGLAEYYALMALYESGGLTEEEKDKAIAGFRKRGQKAKSLLTDRSRGDTTAKAVDVLARLDGALAMTAAGGLDVVLAALSQADQPITTALFEELVNTAADSDMSAFFEAYVRPRTTR
ncbi:MAG: hypothetical protein AAGD10_13530 [Myxococcota bacterium]